MSRINQPEYPAIMGVKINPTGSQEKRKPGINNVNKISRMGRMNHPDNPVHPVIIP